MAKNFSKKMENYEARKKELHQQLQSTIERLPAGLLSGGRPVVDEGDSSTWRYSADPEQRRWYKELYGEPLFDSEGLTAGEKVRLYAEGRRQIDAVTPDHVAESRKLAKRGNKASDALWNDFRVTYPEYANNPDAVGRAAERLAASSGMTTADLIDLAKRRPNEVIERIADELYNDNSGQSYDYGSDYSGYSDYSANVPSGRPARQPAKADEPEADMFEEMSDWQVRNGFHR
ncbi:hypothetical protein [Mesorhizobium sp. DCY119]|uniref:hypothetical protein n=1 Tax=Mesorhizobium sp. DCY119 TaxID=2108445 RepID=UPI000E7701A1|nr:hypothetical protein [Mesorhizobium sp. DCY119]RJG45469.1 hypothetical protein D3Y55_15195 [Mesorhizobium sp. DCY119]